MLDESESGKKCHDNYQHYDELTWCYLQVSESENESESDDSQHREDLTSCYLPDTDYSCSSRLFLLCFQTVELDLSNWKLKSSLKYFKQNIVNRNWTPLISFQSWKQQFISLSWTAPVLVFAFPDPWDVFAQSGLKIKYVSQIQIWNIVNEPC